MIKIVHIAKPISGVGVYINLLCKYIDNSKFTSILIFNEKDNTIPVYDSFGKPIETHHVNILRHINLINDISCLLTIIKQLKLIKPDVIHCHSAKAGLLGRIAGFYLKIPTVYTPHAYSYLSASSKIKRTFYKKTEEIFKYLPARTLCCSLSEKNRTEKDLKFPLSKILLWNNSIEDKFELEEFRFHFPKDFICAIGRPSYQKNLLLLVESFYEIIKEKQDLHLIILGSGNDCKELRAIKLLIGKLNLESKITLVPWLDRNKTLFVLQKASLYVSTSRYEGLPYSLIEALALSKACVVTNVDGNRDLIENGINGYCVNENIVDISAAVLKISSNVQLRETMEKNSRKLYNRKFNINKNINLLENVYLNLI